MTEDVTFARWREHARQSYHSKEWGLTAKDIPPEIKRILDEAAGKDHSAEGSVMQCLAEILTVDRMRRDVRLVFALQKVRAIVRQTVSLHIEAAGNCVVCHTDWKCDTVITLGGIEKVIREGMA